MNRTFFIADTHFGHKNILTSCHRPFKNVDAMNKALIANWNSVVNQTDTVYHLGDVFGVDEKGKGALIYSLNGHKILVPGNHDNHSCEYYASVGFNECYGKNKLYEITLEGEKLFLSHYPPLPEEIKKDALYLFGHMHYRISEVENSHPGLVFCVSVERIGYKPISFSEILSIIRR